MEEDGADIVEVAVEGEEAPACLVRPDLDLVVVTARYKKGLPPRQHPAVLPSAVSPHLCLVEVDAADRAIVLFESVNQGAHPIVPQLNGGRVEGDEDPWSGIKALVSVCMWRGSSCRCGPFRVECDALCARRLGLELQQQVSNGSLVLCGTKPEQADASQGPGRTFVSIPEEACILAEGTRGLAGSRHQRGVEGGCAERDGNGEYRDSGRKERACKVQQPEVWRRG